MSQNATENYKMAFASLTRSLSTPVEDERDLAGVIQHFEFTYETSWKALRHWLDHEGIGANTPREVFSRSYQAHWIQNESAYVNMIKDRNLTVHTYNQPFAQEMLKRIQMQYYPLFEEIMKFILEKENA